MHQIHNLVMKGFPYTSCGKPGDQNYSRDVVDSSNRILTPKLCKIALTLTLLGARFRRHSNCKQTNRYREYASFQKYYQLITGYSTKLEQ